MTDLKPGDRVRHKQTGHEYTFHAYPSSQDFPGSRYVKDADGAIKEFRADQIEAIDEPATMTDLTPDTLDRIEKAATRRQVVNAYVNGEPDGMANAVLTLVARVRDLEAQVKRVRDLHSPMSQYRPGGLNFCSHCTEDQFGQPTPSDWPCDTIKALGEGS